MPLKAYFHSVISSFEKASNNYNYVIRIMLFVIINQILILAGCSALLLFYNSTLYTHSIL